MNWCYIILIGIELIDNVFDALATAEYLRKKLFRNPKQSVQVALLAFVIIGCLVSFVRICLYICRMYCFNEDGDDEEDEVCCDYAQCSICVDAIKLIIEVFPQSVIAKFLFDGCPIKKSNMWKFLDTGFDIFCITPFFFFIYSLSWWYCCGNGTKKGKCMFCFITFATVISSVGFGFAIASFLEGISCP